MHSSSVGLCLWAVVMICATLVTYRHTHSLLTGYSVSSATWAKNYLSFFHVHHCGVVSQILPFWWSLLCTCNVCTLLIQLWMYHCYKYPYPTQVRQPAGRGGFRHVQHVWPNRGTTKRRPSKKHRKIKYCACSSVHCSMGPHFSTKCRWWLLCVSGESSRAGGGEGYSYNRDPHIFFWTGAPLRVNPALPVGICLNGALCCPTNRRQAAVTPYCCDRAFSIQTCKLHSEPRYFNVWLRTMELAPELHRSDSSRPSNKHVQNVTNCSVLSLFTTIWTQSKSLLQ